MKTRWLFRVSVLAFVAALAFAAPAHADDDGDRGSHDGSQTESERDDDGDHDLAHELVERGEIRALQDILGVVAEVQPGKVVSVRLDRDGGRWVYALKVVTPGGTRIKVKLDDASLAILDAERQ